MMKKKEELMDLSQMSDDEIRYKGVKFLRDLIKVLEEYEPFYMTQFNFRYLNGVLISAKERLKQEEQEVV
ncbi:MAG TPA: hypothetical protein VIK14_14160 [Ignavibacteria bacterium]